MQITPTTFPISWFRDRKVDNSLVLKPPYQRKPVWTVKQKAYLIDTILGGFNIPEIYIHRETDSNGITNYNIVDGQQRIRTILDFIDGDFSLMEEYTPQYADFSFKDLPLDIQKKFWGFTIFAREIVDVTEEEVRNLFKRMNKNVVTLNSQELRHATYSGEFITLLEEETEDTFWSENKIVTPNEIRRMTDVQFVSDVFVSMINGIQDKTTELDRYYRLYENEFPEKSKWKDRFSYIKQEILKIIPNLKDTRWRNKSDFYTIFIALNDLANKNKDIKITKIPKLRRELEIFSSQISEASLKARKGKKVEKSIARYLDAVTKSTTDKDRRITRHRIILSILEKFC